MKETEEEELGVRRNPGECVVMKAKSRECFKAEGVAQL